MDDKSWRAHELGASPRDSQVSGRGHHRHVAAIERTMAVATLRASRLRTDIGRELRQTRVSRGLSQSAVADATGIEQAEISRIERGFRDGVTIHSLARLAAAVGLEVSIRMYPAGQPDEHNPPR
jgi:predicted XRE-type DNA-binding protein